MLRYEQSIIIKVLLLIKFLDLRLKIFIYAQTLIINNQI